MALQCRPPPCHLLAKAPHYPGRPPENFEILAHILCTRNSSRNILSIFAPLQVVVSLGGMKVQNMPNMPSMPKKHSILCTFGMYLHLRVGKDLPTRASHNIISCKSPNGRQLRHAPGLERQVKFLESMELQAQNLSELCRRRLLKEFQD